ncbi:MAG TPA: carboxypeptidase [Xanthobacteraceae bacterium]|nr:carboxypeptidase [Xanthobacteraceae bacterium]
MKTAHFLLAFALITGVATPAPAQDKPAKPESEARQRSGVLALLPADSVTEHAVDTRARRIAYTATAGTLPIFDQSGERKASVFYTAYVASGGDANRPVTFLFNGGPGAASVYLHLGVAGPKVLDFGPSGRDGAAARLRDNAETWLEFSDLVFIDPIGTGWSRPAKADDTSFYGVRQDAQVLAKVIALYLARTGRTGSPKYLAGESYGGFRAQKVAHVLQQDQGIVVSGIVMVSPLIEGGYVFGGGDRYSLGCALQLPSVVAAELERNGAFTPQAIAEAERFALTDYIATLAGRPPQGDAAQAFYDRLGRMTGLPADLVARSRGCVRNAYLKHRREAQRELLSIYDATFASPDPYPEQENRRGSDPVLDGFTRALGGAFVGYARDHLGFKTDMTYAVLNGEVNGKWEWEHGSRGSPPSVTEDIREFLSLNPSFRLLVVHGYADLVTPYAVSRYVIDHMPDFGDPDRVQLKIYPGGHMFYFAERARIAFTDDVKAFYQAIQ